MLDHKSFKAILLGLHTAMSDPSPVCGCFKVNGKQSLFVAKVMKVIVIKAISYCFLF